MATERRIKIVVDGKNAKREIKDVDREMRGLGKSSDKTSAALSTLSKVAAAVISAVAIRRIIQYADKFSELRTQLKLVTDSTNELNKTTQTLLELANSTASDLSGTVGVYTKLTRATKQLGSSQEEILAVTKAINQSFVISGASAEEASNAIRQLNQGLASGVLRGEEFNAINENADRLARALADSLGVTRGELRALAAEGQLTTERVFSALQGQAAQIDKEFQQVDLTVGRAFGNLLDSATVATGRVDQSVGATRRLAKAIDSVADAINSIDASKFDSTINFLNEVDRTALFSLQNTSGIPILQSALDAKSAFEAIGFGEENTNLKNINESLKETVSLFGKLASITGLPSQNQVRTDRQAGSSSQSTGVLRAPNKFSQIGTTPADLTKKEQQELVARQQLEADAQKVREELQRQTQQKLSEQFLESERSRTERLKAELQKRLEVNKAFQESRTSSEASYFDQQRAQNEFRRREQIALLEEEKANEQIRFEERRQAIVENTKLTEEARNQALAEIRQQQLEQRRIFEAEQTRIDQEAAQARVDIKRAEEQAKLQAALSAGQNLINAIASFNKDSIGLQRVAALASAGIAIAEGIAKAQTLVFPLNIEEAARIAAVGASVASAINKAASAFGGGGGGAQSSPQVASGGGRSPATQRAQEPPTQSTAFEIKGFNEIANELTKFRGDELLPVEYTQRIVASIKDIQTLQGGTS